MTELIDLKKIALNWFENDASDVIGPCEITVNSEENLERTTFTIKLQDIPPVILENLNNLNSQEKIHEKIKFYIEIIQNSFIEIYTYINLEIKSQKYNNACVIANYINSQSNAAYVQIFDNKNYLVVRFKVASSSMSGAGSDVFYYLILTALTPTYHYFKLFQILYELNVDSDKAIQKFEKHIQDTNDTSNTVRDSEEYTDEDAEIVTKIEEFNEEFIKILGSLENSEYWIKNLNFETDSFTIFDELISELWQGDGPMEKNIESVTAVFGSYVAITLMQKFNGEWSIEDEGSWRYILEETEEFPGLAIQPFVWMRKRFDNKESIAEKYESMVIYAQNLKNNE